MLNQLYRIHAMRHYRKDKRKAAEQVLGSYPLKVRNVAFKVIHCKLENLIIYINPLSFLMRVRERTVLI